MIQIALLAASIVLIVLGCKGIFGSGLTVTRSKSLTGGPAKLVGIVCIVMGLGLIPATFFFVGLFSR